ncbi:MAG: hypothetical protein LBG08_00155 [Spirochaetaceae bacterium]|jgi:hypothetical protein|nr:hypothetical protein [Spirochaetaceae bacterium]
MIGLDHRTARTAQKRFPFTRRPEQLQETARAVPRDLRAIEDQEIFSTSLIPRMARQSHPAIRRINSFQKST